MVDILNAAVDKCCSQSALPLVWTQSQISLTLAGAVAIGTATGIMFGAMDVEDHLYRLQYEGLALIGVSSACGALTGVANGLLTHSSLGAALNEHSQLTRAVHDAT